MKKLISIILAIMMLAGITTVSIAEEEAQAAFTGSMILSGTTEAAPGEQVLLRAIVADANLAYTVTWQTYNAGEEKWVKASEGNDYSFAAPGAGSYTYRAHLKAEDDTVIDREITLTVIAPEPVKEPEPAPAPAPEPAPAPAPEPEPAPAPAPAARTYVVMPGDTLWGIAKKFYGTGFKWGDIYYANTDIIKNPRMIYVGQVLQIP